MSVEVSNESGIEVDELRLVALSRHVLDAMRIHPLAELSILLVDEGEMANLHERWMDEPGPTDVLSFPMDELRPGRVDTDPDDDADPGMVGDVVLCPAVAEKQGKEAGHSVQDELELLCTHGILHLLGYDHAEPDEHREMFGLQKQLLTAWRSGRPEQ
ncbi:MAG TPA: rRNA maturation RNase YbeY [Acidothermaceae bacterium]|nr:rRNA maturation RNase YbeY [Acidothermaceae bacterium]